MTTSLQASSAGPAVSDDEETIELVLTPEEVEALTRAAADAEAAAAHPSEVPAIEPVEPFLMWPAEGASTATSPVRPSTAQTSRTAGLRMGVAAGAILLLSGVCYWTIATVTRDRPPAVATITAPEQPATAAEPSVPAPAPEALPVRFANPFDVSEIFEFPPGTTQAEARSAVAELLLNRARERQRALPEARRRGKKMADHDPPANQVTAPRRG